MNKFEDELKMALRREEPSPDFTDRVMARINNLPAQSKQEKSRENIDWWQKLLVFFSAAINEVGDGGRDGRGFAGHDFWRHPLPRTSDSVEAAG